MIKKTDLNLYALFIYSKIMITQEAQYGQL